jgi:hypothetical protein
MRMTRQERYLTHQIHPLKLATDWGSAFVSLYFFWHHDLLVGLLILFVPSVIASFALISAADLQGLRDSPFGRYVARYMPPALQAVRFLGMLIAVLAAWHHAVLGIAAGFLVIILAWTWGLLRAAASA